MIAISPSEIPPGTRTYSKPPKALAAAHLGVALDKPKRLQLVNWEKQKLSTAELSYAASDAWVGCTVLLGPVGTEQAAEGRRRLHNTRGHYRAKYVMELTKNVDGTGPRAYEVDGRGSSNLAHLVNAYKTGDPGGRKRVTVDMARSCTGGMRTYRAAKKGASAYLGER